MYKTDAMEEFKRLIAVTKAAAAEPENRSQETPADANSAANPGNEDSVDQAKQSGSNTEEVAGAAGEHADNGNGPGVQEIGEDPASGSAPAPKTEVDYIPELTKTAEALEALADRVARHAAAEVAAELVVRKRAEAIDEATLQLMDTLGVDEESAAVVAEALANGEITEDELVAAAEDTESASAIAEATGATPEEVLQVAEEIGAVAEATGETPEQIAEKALAVAEQGDAEQLVKEARAEYARSRSILRRARAEKDFFTAHRAASRMASILEHLTGKTASVDEIIDAEAPAADDADEAGTRAADANAEEAAPGTAETAGEEQIAADMLGDGTSAEDLAVIEEAIQELAEDGVPIEVIEEMVANEYSRNVPEVVKTASAENPPGDLLAFAHVYLREKVAAGRRLRAGK